MADSPYFQWFGIRVVDPDGYRRYRENMMPILERFGGRFAHDLVVSDVLRSDSSVAMNRVFMMVFPDRAASRAFFGDPRYREIRARYFETAVDGVESLAEERRRHTA